MAHGTWDMCRSQNLGPLPNFGIEWFGGFQNPQVVCGGGCAILIYGGGFCGAGVYVLCMYVFCVVTGNGCCTELPRPGLVLHH